MPTRLSSANVNVVGLCLLCFTNYIIRLEILHIEPPFYSQIIVKLHLNIIKPCVILYKQAMCLFLLLEKEARETDLGQQIGSCRGHRPAEKMDRQRRVPTRCLQAILHFFFYHQLFLPYSKVSATPKIISTIIRCRPNKECFHSCMASSVSSLVAA